MKFEKWHANGNSFVIIDEIDEEVVEERMKQEFSRVCCNSSFGVGCDGVGFLSRSNKADVKMRIFNPDGSEAESCGNLLRCIASYMVKTRKYDREELSVETLAGISKLKIRMDGERVWSLVTLGFPKFRREDIPARASAAKKEMLEEEILGYAVSAVNVGVPHAVIFLNYEDELERMDVDGIGREIRYHPVFTRGANVDFACVSGNSICVRTYERGVEKETSCCGTGAAASVVVAKKLKKIPYDLNPVEVVTRGGQLRVWYEIGSEVSIEGYAERIAHGHLELKIMNKSF